MALSALSRTLALAADDGFTALCSKGDRSALGLEAVENLYSLDH
jgi:hypothetical protein